MLEKIKSFVKADNLVLRQIQKIRDNSGNGKTLGFLISATSLTACGGATGGGPTANIVTTAPIPDFSLSNGNQYSGSDQADTLNQGNTDIGLRVYGYGGNDTINTGSGADIIDGGSGDDTINSGDGNDVIWGGYGLDTINAGGGNDIIIVVGITDANQYTSTAITNSGGKGTNLSSLLSLADLNDNPESDAIAGEFIDGGSGNNTLYVYGTVDFTDVILINISNVVINSDVIFADDQLGVSAITKIDGDGGSIIRIVSYTGDPVEVDLSDLDISGVNRLDLGENVIVIASSGEDLRDTGITLISGSGTLQITEFNGRVDLLGLTIEEGLIIRDSAGSLVESTSTGATVITYDQVLHSESNDNNGPTDISLYTDFVYENEDGVIIGEVYTTDQDFQDVHSYSVDDERFEIVDDELKLKNGISLDYETEPFIEILISTNDLGGRTLVKAFTLEVWDKNEAPTLTAAPFAIVNENTNTVMTVTSSDIDEDFHNSYFLWGDDAYLFNIDDNGVITFDKSPNFEDPDDLDGDNIYNFNVEVSDFGGLIDTQAVSVTVNDVNEAPTLTAPETISMEENITTVLTVTSSDMDVGDSKTYSLTGDDAALFTIDTDGNVTFNTAPDYGAPLDKNGNNIYDITIIVTDGGGLIDTQAVTITITEENFAPILTAAPTSNVVENKTDVMTVTSTDANVGDIISYSLTGDDAALFAIDSNGVLTFKSAPNFEVPTDSDTDNIYNIIVVASDVDGLTDTQTVAITVTGINEAPVLTATSIISIVENTTAVTNVSSVDDDAGDTKAFSLTGDDAALFSIDNSGVITFDIAPDFDIPGDVGTNNVYNFTVVVTDAAGLFDSEDVAVTVTPTVALSATLIPHLETGAGIGSLTTVTDDPGAITYTVNDNRFEVIDGLLKIIDGQSFDMETTETVDIIITSTDGAGTIVNRTITLSVGETHTPESYTHIGTISTSGNNLIDGLLYGTSYKQDLDGLTTTISYSFLGADSLYSTDPYLGYDDPSTDREPWVYNQIVDSQGQSIFRDVLDATSTVASISFFEVLDSQESAGQVRLGWSDGVSIFAAAHAYYPNVGFSSSDIWLSNVNLNQNSPSGFFKFALFHELGHALGLKHSFDVINGFPALNNAYDGGNYTVMAYSLVSNDPSLIITDLYPQSFMWVDILALQYIFGGNLTHNNSDNTYTFSDQDRYFLTLWDTGGNDTITISGSTDTQIDLTPGSWSNVGTTITYYRSDFTTVEQDQTVFIPPEVTIENATGGLGNDELTGNDAANILQGNAGDDVLNGGLEDDSLFGGTGDDVLAGGSGADILDGGEDEDRANYAASPQGITINLNTNSVSGGDGEGDSLSNIENITGSQYADTITGDAANNKLYGEAGDDTLDGGLGDDLLETGSGNDILVFNDEFGNDTITDFDDGADLLNFQGHSTVTQYSDLTITVVGSDTVIDDGNGNTITIEGITSGIDATDFIF